MFRKLKRFFGVDVTSYMTVNVDSKVEISVSQPGYQVDEKDPLIRRHEYPGFINEQKILDFVSFAEVISAAITNDNLKRVSEQYPSELKYHYIALIDKYKQSGKYHKLIEIVKLNEITNQLKLEEVLVLLRLCSVKPQYAMDTLLRQFPITQLITILYSERYKQTVSILGVFICDELKHGTTQQHTDAYIDLLRRISFRRNSTIPTCVLDLVAGIVPIKQAPKLLSVCEQLKRLFNVTTEKTIQFLVQGGYEIGTYYPTNMEEKERDCVFAYKAVSLSCQSIYNPNIIYDKNLDYFTICNYDISNETSWGFGAWTYEKAFEFGKNNAPIKDEKQHSNIITIVKCAMDLEYILCLPYHGYKIRSAHMQILETVSTVDVYKQIEQIGEKKNIPDSPL